MIIHPHTPSSLLTTITTREASSSEIPRAVPPLPTHLNYFAGIWGELPLGIRDSLLQVSLDDAAGCVVQAKTSAYQVARTNAEEVHRRITTVLRRQQDEIAAAIPEAERGLADLQRAVHECELRLASLRQRAQDTDEAISSADTLPDTFLRDLRFAAPQPPTTAPLASPVASTSVDLQPLATVSLAAHATPTSAGSQSPTPTADAARMVSIPAFSALPAVTSVSNPTVMQLPAPCLPWVDTTRGGKNTSSKASPPTTPDAHLDLRISKQRYHNAALPRLNDLYALSYRICACLAPFTMNTCCLREIHDLATSI